MMLREGEGGSKQVAPCLSTHGEDERKVMVCGLVNQL